MFDVAIARALLTRLREADRGFEVFGADVHRYELGPRLADAELGAWEREHGIGLPPEYRAFITELGNGGAGPFYGVFPLGVYDDGSSAILGDLSSPFPHRQAWNLPPARLEPPEEFGSDEEEDAWNDALDAEYYSPALVDGAFWICDHGCALRTALVVTGPERGNVWFDGRADRTGIVPHTDERGRHLSFGEWYLEWLERSLRELTP